MVLLFPKMHQEATLLHNVVLHSIGTSNEFGWRSGHCYSHLEFICLLVIAGNGAGSGRWGFSSLGII